MLSDNTFGTFTLKKHYIHTVWCLYINVYINTGINKEFLTCFFSANGELWTCQPAMYCSLLNGNKSQALRSDSNCKLNFVMSPLPLVWKSPHQVLQSWENQFTLIQ